MTDSTTASAAPRDPYTRDAAERYDRHHGKQLRNRLTSRRELAVLTSALRKAKPQSALDLPCGTGRFWPAFAAAGVSEVLAADVSQGMLEVARSNRLKNRLNERCPQSLFYASAFDVPLPDDSVDFVACMRFYHHLGRAEDRALLLSELMRITRRYIGLSLWVDGNLGAMRRARKPASEPRPGYGKRTCQPRDRVEAEFRQAGLSILRKNDIWPGISMWRFYLLAKAS